MSFRNEGEWDRALRTLVGIVLLYAVLDGYLAGAVRLIVGVVGVVALATGLAGYCPAYTVFGITTLKRRTP